MKTRSAFTLIECLAAMAFMAILMPVVMRALTLANRNAVVAERTAVAAQLGENKLNELLVTNAWSSGGTGGNFGEKYPGYGWKLSSANWSAAQMTELTMAVTFSVQSQTHEVRLSTLANQTLTQQQQTQLQTLSQQQ